MGLISENISLFKNFYLKFALKHRFNDISYNNTCVNEKAFSILPSKFIYNLSWIQLQLKNKLALLYMYIQRLMLIIWNNLREKKTEN